MRCFQTAATFRGLIWILVCGLTIPTLGQSAPGKSTSAAVPGSLTDLARLQVNLPDSPGTVLRRRTSPDEDVDGVDTANAQQAASEQKAAASAAKASDKPSAAHCGASGTGARGPTTDARTPIDGIASRTTSDNGGAALGRSDTSSSTDPTVNALSTTNQPCSPAPNPYQRFLNSTAPIPLTAKQKGFLAIHNFLDPGNIITVLGTSAIAIGSDAHTAYGPGIKGFGENAGLSFVQDATGDFFGTFLIPSIAHQDPHYHRLPEASIPRRVLHAISRTVIAQGDDGHAMPNYSTLLTYPITAEIANLYVPGVAGNGPATVKRVAVAYATDPIDNLITEFLPDVAKRVHVRVIFVQQIVNQVAAGQPVSMF